MSIAARTHRDRAPRVPTYQAPALAAVRVTPSEIEARFADGRIVQVPLSWSWRLELATPEERAAAEIGPGGHTVHWRGVDEDLTAAGFLSGTPAPRPSVAQRQALLAAARDRFTSEQGEG